MSVEGVHSPAAVRARPKRVSPGVIEERIQQGRQTMPEPVLHVDIGGEGRYPAALNLNPSPVSMQGDPIPRRIEGTSGFLPFADASVGVITLENAPIAPETGAEIARVLRPGGEVRLENPAPYALQMHRSVIEALGAPFSQAAQGVQMITRIVR